MHSAEWLKLFLFSFHLIFIVGITCDVLGVMYWFSCSCNCSGAVPVKQLRERIWRFIGAILQLLGAAETVISILAFSSPFIAEMGFSDKGLVARIMSIYDVSGLR